MRSLVPYAEGGLHQIAVPVHHMGDRIRHERRQEADECEPGCRPGEGMARQMWVDMGSVAGRGTPPRPGNVNGGVGSKPVSSSP